MIAFLFFWSFLSFRNKIEIHTFIELDIYTFIKVIRFYVSHFPGELHVISTLEGNIKGALADEIELYKSIYISREIVICEDSFQSYYSENK